MGLSLGKAGMEGNWSSRGMNLGSFEFIINWRWRGLGVLVVMRLLWAHVKRAAKPLRNSSVPSQTSSNGRRSWIVDTSMWSSTGVVHGGLRRIFGSSGHRD